MGRLIGIDYGEKRIGVAVSDPMGLMAQPVAVVNNAEQLKKILLDYDDISEMVVGLPITMAGEVGIQARKVLDFVEELKKMFTFKISTWDERLTTAVAEKNLISAGFSREKRKRYVDRSAAAYILQSYLDSRRQ